MPEQVLGYVRNRGLWELRVIEILTHPVSEFSIARAQSETLIRVAGGWTDGKLHQVIVMDDMIVLMPCADQGDHAETVAFGDRMIVDGEVYIVHERGHNGPSLLKVDS